MHSHISLSFTFHIINNILFILNIFKTNKLFFELRINNMLAFIQQKIFKNKSKIKNF